GHRDRGGDHVGKPHEQGPDPRLDGEQPHQGTGDDAHRPLGADDQAAQVEADRVGGGAAEHGHLATRQHDFHGEDVAGGVPLGEAVGTARVVGDVAADGARLLGRRVRGEIEAVGSGGVTQVEVDDPGADPGGAVARVDVDLLHGGGHDHDPALGGTGP